MEAMMILYGKYGTRILYEILWLFEYLFEIALGFVWIVVGSIF